MDEDFRVGESLRDLGVIGDVIEVSMREPQADDLEA